MNRNMGQTSLPKKRRSRDPMRAYDALPKQLREWLAQAALPWSPTSARRIWKRAQSRGCTLDEALDLLRRAESKTLSRDRHFDLTKQVDQGLERAN